MRVEYGFMFVSLPGQREVVRGAEFPARRIDALPGPRCPFTRNRLGECCVATEQVVLMERGSLVLDAVYRVSHVVIMLVI